jgi:hypothetical protein
MEGGAAFLKGKALDCLVRSYVHIETFFELHSNRFCYQRRPVSECQFAMHVHTPIIYPEFRQVRASLVSNCCAGCGHDSA